MTRIMRIPARLMLPISVLAMTTLPDNMGSMDNADRALTARLILHSQGVRSRVLKNTLAKTSMVVPSAKEKNTSRY